MQVMKELELSRGVCVCAMPATLGVGSALGLGAGSAAGAAEAPGRPQPGNP